MSRTQYQIYKEQTFVLARTLIVKHEEIASSMNTDLYYRGYAVDSNPYNWRYYLNLSGEYHAADHDALQEKYGTPYMMVKMPSEVGPIEIPFTKELLHGAYADAALANEYQIDSRFYKELISVYPDFEPLIVGIINPVDIDVAVNARNGEILHIAGIYKKMTGTRRWFDVSANTVNEVLIEPQEDDILIKLQQYIDDFLRHWNNPEYAHGNDLYAATMLGVLYVNIPSAILNIRLGNCKTIRAHTFHIRQYLNSHGGFGAYVDNLPIATALWLYRNTLYLESNAGKQLTFDTYLDNALTPNKVPMSAYAIRHELSNMSHDKLLPTGMLYKEVLNFEVVGASDDDRTVMDILEDEIGLARSNDKDLDEKAARIQESIDWGGDDRINSKVLESEMMELGEPYPFTLEQFLFNLWGYGVSKGTYTATVHVSDPVTGDRLGFTVKNAYLLTMYCMNKAVAGVTLDKIPPVRLYNIPRTDDEFDLPTDKRFGLKPDSEYFKSKSSPSTRKLKILEVMGSHRPNYNNNRANDFYQAADDIYHERIRKYDTYSAVEDLEERGDLERICKELYWMGFEETIHKGSFMDFFRSIGYDPSELSQEDLMTLALSLTMQSLGITDDKISRRKWLQKSLMDIMRHFISYTVHVIEKFTDGEVCYLEGKSLRFSNIECSYTEPLPVKHNIQIDYLAKTDVLKTIHLDISNLFEETNIDVLSSVNGMFDLSGMKYEGGRHTVYAGVYSLSGSIRQVNTETYEGEVITLRVIDTHANTAFIGSVIASATSYHELIYMPVDASGVINPYVNTAIVDDGVFKYFFDVKRHGALLTPMQAAQTDDDINPNNVNDVTTLLPVGILGNVSDQSLNLKVIDDQALISSMIRLSEKVDDITVPKVNDMGGMTIQGVVLSHKDDSIYIQTHDDQGIYIDDIDLAFEDPQVHPRGALPDVHSTLVGDITLNQLDIPVDVLGLSTNGLMVDINALTLDVEEDGIALETDVDSAAMLIAATTAVVDDVLDELTDSDNSTIIVSEMTVTVNDDPSALIEISDDVAAGITHVTASVTDEASANALDVDGLVVTQVTASNVDDEQNVITDDVTGVIVTDITLQRYDSPLGGEGSGNEAIMVNDITMSQVDGERDMNATDNDQIDVVDPEIIIVDDSLEVSTTESVGMVMASIVSTTHSENIDYSASNNGAVLVDVEALAVTTEDCPITVANTNEEEMQAVYLDSNTITIRCDDEMLELDGDSENALTVDNVTMRIYDIE